MPFAGRRGMTIPSTAFSEVPQAPILVEAAELVAAFAILSDPLLPALVLLATGAAFDCSGLPGMACFPPVTAHGLGWLTCATSGTDAPTPQLLFEAAITVGTTMSARSVRTVAPGNTISLQPNREVEGKTPKSTIQ